MHRLRNRCAAALAVATLVTIPTAPARAAGVAGGRPLWRLAVTAPPPAGDSAPAAVVGLDADAPEQGAALTRALRRAFAARGLSGGKEVSLSELRLALGCKGSSPECLAQGGELLGARRLIYGTLRRAKGGGWQLEATLLEVDGVTVTSASMSLGAAELSPEQISTTAETIAARLAPDTEVSDVPTQGQGGLAPPPPPPPEPSLAEDEPEEEEDAPTGTQRWGWQRPQPRWKLAAFGASAGMTAVTAGATIGMSVWLTSNNVGFRKQLLDAANASLTDDNPANDVDPSLPEAINLCDYALARPTDENGNPLGMPGQVTNSAVAKVCNKGDMIRKAQLATGIATGVSAVSLMVFTVLLFVHREPARASAWRRHGLSVGADPVPGQGLSLRMSGRF